MGSTFSTYNIATTGMYNGQAALTTVSTNLSNINTTGYSRQRIISTEQTVVLSGTNSYGTGVAVDSIERVRDSFLDKTYRDAKAGTEYWKEKDSVLEDAQALLNEYDGTDSTTATDDSNGLQKTIQNFFDSWSDLSNDPSSQSARKSLVESASAMLNVMNDLDEELADIQENAGARLTTGVSTLNDLAKQVATLNGQIIATENCGNSANDLEDARDELIDEMSALTNVSVAEQSDGSADVYIGSVSLVKGITSRSLTTAEDDNQQLYVKWTDLNCEASITNGSLKAYREEANTSAVTAIQDTADYNFKVSGDSSVANLRQGLNNLLTTIADQVNTILTSGKDLYGDTGVALFVASDANTTMSVGNITLNSTITDTTTGVNKIAAGTTGGSEDNTLALKINKLQETDILKADGLSMSVTDYYQTLVSWVGTTGDTVDSNYDTQDSLLLQADTQRKSTAAVSQDEELSKMITYQNAYNASARVLNTVDQMIGDMIEALGT